MCKYRRVNVAWKFMYVCVKTVESERSRMEYAGKNESEEKEKRNAKGGNETANKTSDSLRKFIHTHTYASTRKKWERKGETLGRERRRREDRECREREKKINCIRRILREILKVRVLLFSFLLLLLLLLRAERLCTLGAAELPKVKDDSGTRGFQPPTQSVRALSLSLSLSCSLFLSTSIPYCSDTGEQESERERDRKREKSSLIAQTRKCCTNDAIKNITINY